MTLALLNGLAIRSCGMQETSLHDGAEVLMQILQAT